MLSDLLADCGQLPDVWGEGALFAFSGLDGSTNTDSGWVGTFGREPYGLLFHTPTRRYLDFALPGQGRPRICTGDVLGVSSAAGDLLLAYSAWHTLVGVAPVSASTALRIESGAAAVDQQGVWLSADDEHGDAVALARTGTRLALSWGSTPEEARQRAEQGLREDAFQVAAQRLAPYRGLPRLASARWQRLLNKAVSVLRVNTLAAEGTVGQAWTTPDRVPHRDRWLWDTVFHSFALNAFWPRTSWESIKSVLDAQWPDGMIPHQMSVSGWTSAITQPPVLAWGVWENYCALGDREALAWALPRLERYLEWDLTKRDRNGNGLLEWRIDGDVRCRSGESGMDNSPRFDAAALLDAVEFSAFAAHDMLCLARAAEALGDADRAALWRARGRAMSERVHSDLWDPQANFYVDRDMQGVLSAVRAVSGFMPLLLDDTPAERVRALVAALHDPAQFGTAFPVGSVAADDPEFSTDMWRGGTFLNMNFCIAAGLEQHSLPGDARRLVELSLAQMERYYVRYGVLFEFYDAKHEVPPVACDRKGPRQEPYDIRRKTDSIRDYGWTAASVVCWLLRYAERAPDLTANGTAR